METQLDDRASTGDDTARDDPLPPRGRHRHGRARDRKRDRPHDDDRTAGIEGTESTERATRCAATRKRDRSGRGARSEPGGRGGGKRRRSARKTDTVADESLWHTLCEEMLCMLLGYLEVRDLLACRAASCEFRERIEALPIWRDRVAAILAGADRGFREAYAPLVRGCLSRRPLVPEHDPDERAHRRAAADAEGVTGVEGDGEKEAYDGAAGSEDGTSGGANAETEQVEDRHRPTMFEAYFALSSLLHPFLAEPAEGGGLLFLTDASWTAPRMMEAGLGAGHHQAAVRAFRAFDDPSLAAAYPPESEWANTPLTADRDAPCVVVAEDGRVVQIYARRGDPFLVRVPKEGSSGEDARVATMAAEVVTADPLFDNPWVGPRIAIWPRERGPMLRPMGPAASTRRSRRDARTKGRGKENVAPNADRCGRGHWSGGYFWYWGGLRAPPDFAAVVPLPTTMPARAARRWIEAHQWRWIPRSAQTDAASVAIVYLHSPERRVVARLFDASSQRIRAAVLRMHDSRRVPGKACRRLPDSVPLAIAGPTWANYAGYIPPSHFRELLLHDIRSLARGSKGRIAFAGADESAGAPLAAALVRLLAPPSSSSSGGRDLSPVPAPDPDPRLGRSPPPSPSASVAAAVDLSERRNDASPASESFVPIPAELVVEARRLLANAEVRIGRCALTQSSLLDPRSRERERSRRRSRDRPRQDEAHRPADPRFVEQYLDAVPGLRECLDALRAIVCASSEDQGGIVL